MNVTLKPFDFAQAVARAGLGIDGVPLARGGAAPGTGVAPASFEKALGEALGAVSQSQNDAARLQREVPARQPDGEPRADDGRDAEGADRLPGDAAGAQPAGAGLLGHHGDAGLGSARGDQGSGATLGTGRSSSTVSDGRQSLVPRSVSTIGRLIRIGCACIACKRSSSDHFGSSRLSSA